jgi:integrase
MRRRAHIAGGKQDVAKTRPPAPVKLPKTHRVFFDLAGGRVAIYWYRRRGQKPALIQFEGDTLMAAVRAEFAGAERIIQAYNTTPEAPPAATIREVVAQYKAAPNGGKRLSGSTRALWTPWLDAFAREFGDLPLRAVGAKGLRTDIVAWRDRFGDTPRAADTAMQAVNRLFNWALDRELVEKNPAAGVEGLYSANRADVIVEPDELAAILKHMSKPGQLAVRLAAATGLRRGDLIDLRWNEVGDFYIERAANKSTVGRRILVPLIAEARAVVAELRALNKASDVPTTHVLRSSRGPWQEDGLGVTWWKARKLAARVVPSIADKHFNDLRGTACTRFYMTIDRVTDEEVADIMAWEVANCRAIRKRYVDTSRIARGIVARIERGERGG